MERHSDWGMESAVVFKGLVLQASTIASTSMVASGAEYLQQAKRVNSVSRVDLLCNRTDGAIWVMNRNGQ